MLTTQITAPMRTFRLYSKFLTLTHDSVIEDECYHQVGRIKGSLLSLGCRYDITDEKGRKLGRLAKKFLSLVSHFTIEREGHPSAVMRRIVLTEHRFQFTIESEGAPPLDVISRRGDLDYTIERAGHLVARIARGGTQASDAYLVHIRVDEEPILPLACTMALDLSCHDHESDGEIWGEEKKAFRDWIIVSLSRMMLAVARVFKRPPR